MRAMNDNISQLPPLPENVVSIGLSQRTWNGVQVSIANFLCGGEVIHRLPHEELTRLSVVLQEVGGTCEPRLRRDTPCPISHVPRHMLLAPADMEIWGYTRDAWQVVDATLAFDFTALGERLAMKLDPDLRSVPRLRFTDERIFTLVELLSQVVGNTDPSMELYGDGITAAIASQLFSPAQNGQAPSGGLAPWQLRRVVDYMEAHLPQRVGLGALAEMVGLSQAHFCRAFKASTGLAPYQWQLDARVRRAQESLAHSDASISEVAQATGFADAVHFGRMFRKVTGVTPGVWRRERKE